MLIEYIRKGKYHSKKKIADRKKVDENYSRRKINSNNNRKKGVLIAMLCVDDVVRIGWSLCKFSAGDKFTRRGMKIAIDRARRCTTYAPYSIKSQLNDFIDRTKKYYKDKEIVTNILMPSYIKNKKMKKEIEDMTF